jgi:hypothetical protein
MDIAFITPVYGFRIKKNSGLETISFIKPVYPHRKNLTIRQAPEIAHFIPLSVKILNYVNRNINRTVMYVTEMKEPDIW